MLINNIVARIKKRDSVVSIALFNFAKGFLKISIPVVGPTRFFYRVLYSIHVVLRESIIWILRFFYYEPLFRARCEHVGKGLIMEKLPYITGHGRIIIGDNVHLSGKSSFAVGNKLCESSVLEIGNNSTICHACSITAGLRVSIGNNVMMASGVRIMDNDGHPIDATERRQGLPVKRENIRPVEIGDDAWIGLGSYIGKGVVIGERSIIGAFSVVTRSIPPDCIAAGSSARVVRKIGES